MPQHIWITPSYKLKQAFSDAHARMELYPSYYFLHEFFLATVSFKEHITMEKDARSKLAGMAKEFHKKRRMLSRSGTHSLT